MVLVQLPLARRGEVHGEHPQSEREGARVPGGSPTGSSQT